MEVAVNMPIALMCKQRTSMWRLVTENDVSLASAIHSLQCQLFGALDYRIYCFGGNNGQYVQIFDPVEFSMDSSTYELNTARVMFAMNLYQNWRQYLQIPAAETLILSPIIFASAGINILSEPAISKPISVEFFAINPEPKKSNAIKIFLRFIV
jgi:hypothetical protein